MPVHVLYKNDIAEESCSQHRKNLSQLSNGRKIKNLMSYQVRLQRSKIKDWQGDPKYYYYSLSGEKNHHRNKHMAWSYCIVEVQFTMRKSVRICSTVIMPLGPHFPPHGVTRSGMMEFTEVQVFLLSPDGVMGAVCSGGSWSQEQSKTW